MPAPHPCKPHKQGLISLMQRERVCWLCGIDVWVVEAHHPLSPTADHVHPKSLGGYRTPENIRIAHYVCNTYKNNHTVTDEMRRECLRRVRWVISRSVVWIVWSWWVSRGFPIRDTAN